MAAPLADVTRDRGEAGELARRIAHRGDRDLGEKLAAVLAYAHVLDAQ
jgi:NTP pyrophosphatase (non-canonical NTP hydrolase)